MKKLFLFVLVFSSLVSGGKVFAIENVTKIYLGGPSAPVAPLSSIMVDVYLDSTQPINAFDIEVTYQKDKLEFLAPDNTGSIVDIWQRKPAVETPGKVRFAGGILKGFKGTGGLLIKLSFKVLDTGLAADTFQLSFDKGDLYIADGKGTRALVMALGFSGSMKAGAEVFSSLASPFQSTSSDVIIEKELESFKSRTFLQRLLIPLVLLSIIFVICAWSVYNKFKRKP
jgi:hypothetical protein